MRGSIVMLAILATIAAGCPVTGCSCEPAPPQLHVYGRVTTAAEEPAAGANVEVLVAFPDCEADTLRSFCTVSDSDGRYSTPSFDGIYPELCIVVQAVGAGSSENPPRTSVTKKIAGAVAREDSVRVDLALP